MTLDKHTWICSICGQGLTRKSTANRHNNNLHSGVALLVRPYEYIIGRLNGTFSQSDPSLYRRKKNVVSGSIYQQQSTKSNDIRRSVYAQSGSAPLHLQPPDKPVDDVLARADNLEKMSEMMLKLPELKILVNKHLPPLEASLTIANANYLASQGTQRNSDYFDKYLEALRNIDRAKS
jgi:hypothetical protein